MNGQWVQRQYHQRSSNFWVSILNKLFTLIRNRVGPKTGPCGTLKITSLPRWWSHLFSRAVPGSAGSSQIGCSCVPLMPISSSLCIDIGIEWMPFCLICFQSPPGYQFARRGSILLLTCPGENHIVYLTRGWLLCCCLVWCGSIITGCIIVYTLEHWRDNGDF